MTDIQTGPAKPAPNLYDIGAFLSGGLNLTIEEARARIDKMREQQKTLDCERDQEDRLVVSYDLYADLLDSFERLVEMWEDDQHVLVVHDHGGPWTIEHSLRCRATGNMAGCDAQTIMVDHSEMDGWLPVPGRHKIIISQVPHTSGVSEMLSFETLS